VLGTQIRFVARLQRVTCAAQHGGPINLTPPIVKQLVQRTVPPVPAKRSASTPPPEM
jgi:hypothetical protein